jgi:2-polyprenyl-3-methyl-5-hydroxy-6-metoxy-1,4-benzoquinol methylase
MIGTESVRRYWDKNASSFDALYAADSSVGRAFNAIFRRAIFERIRLAAEEIRQLPNATVLDVGCGSGRTTIPLALAGAEHVTGIDFAPQMLDLAREAAKTAGVDKRCSCVLGDFMTDAPGGPFDFVTALGVFDYVDEPVSFLRRMLELSRRSAMFSVPKPSLVRANLRKTALRKARRERPLLHRVQAPRLLRPSGREDRNDPAHRRRGLFRRLPARVTRK